MALSVVGSGGIAGLVNTTAQFTAPASVDADDLFIMWVDTSTYDPPTPAGWTAGPTLTVSGSMRCESHWKWATGSEDSTTQGWAPTTEWATSAGKGIGWICLRGVDKAAWNAMSDADRFETASTTTTTTLNVPVQSVSGGGTFGTVSLWVERSSTPVASPQPTEPAGYTRTSSMTYRTGTGICSGCVAWDLDPETSSVGSGAWSGFSSSSGIGLLTVALPIAVTSSPGNASGSSAWGSGQANAGASAAASIGDAAGSLAQGLGQAGAGSAVALNSATAIGSLAQGGGQARSGSAVGLLSPVAQLTTPIYVAHRGGPSTPNNGTTGPRPENTYAALLKMAQYDHNRTVFECDLATLAAGGGATGEQRLALTHEGDDLSGTAKTYLANETTQATGATTALTYATWKTYRIKTDSGISPAAFAQATTWDEIADWLAANPTRVAMPEMKDAGSKQLLIDSVLARGQQGQVIAQSFDYARCTDAAAAGLNVSWNTSTLTSTTAGNAYAAGIRYVGVDRSIADLAGYCATAHAAGLLVIAYTVNSSANRTAAFSAGCDGIFTNFPNTLNASTGYADGGLAQCDGQASSGGATGSAVAVGSVAQGNAQALAGSASGSATGTATGSVASGRAFAPAGDGTSAAVATAVGSSAQVRGQSVPASGLGEAIALGSTPTGTGKANGGLGAGLAGGVTAVGSTATGSAVAPSGGAIGVGVTTGWHAFGSARAFGGFASEVTAAMIGHVGPGTARSVPTASEGSAPRGPRVKAGTA